MNKHIQKIFTEVPARYELVNHLLTLGLDSVWRKRVARMAMEAGGNLWMDVCSGTGETAVYLKKLAGKKTTIIAYDFCMPMLKIAVDKACDLRFTIGDAARLPFLDNTFDLITISFATRNLNVTGENLNACLREFFRVLKQGGHFINLETSQPKSRLMKKLLHKYAGTTVRPIGELVSGSKAGYAYLSQTIPRFYSAEEFKDIIRSVGFSKVSVTRMLRGVAAIHKAVK